MQTDRQIVRSVDRRVGRSERVRMGLSHFQLLHQLSGDSQLAIHLFPIRTSSRRSSSRSVGQDPVLPDRLHSRRADLAIPAHQRHTQSDCGGRHNSIRHVRYFATADELKDIGNYPVEWSQAASGPGIVERVQQSFPSRRRNSALLYQICQFHKADRRNMNRFSVGGCLVKGRRSLC